MDVYFDTSYEVSVYGFSTSTPVEFCLLLLVVGSFSFAQKKLARVEASFVPEKLLNFVIVFTRYMLMLICMTYNFWIICAVTIGQILVEPKIASPSAVTQGPSV